MFGKLAESFGRGGGGGSQMQDLLQKVEFFSGLEDRILKKVAESVITKQFAKDEVIVRQGEMGLGAYVIVRGRVAVEKEIGEARIKVAELAAEQCFAEMSIVDNQPRSATVLAMEDTECLLLTRDSFVNLMQKYPEIPIRVAKLLAERLRAMDQKLAAAPPSAAGGSTQAAAAGAGAAGGAEAPASANGDKAPEPGSASGTKGQIQEALLNAFQQLYTMKAMTRFSVAVLGCPVEGVSADAVEYLRVGEVKVAMFPAERASRMAIEASAPGTFTVHVFSPERNAPAKFGPAPIVPEDRYVLSLPSGTLTNGV